MPMREIVRVADEAAHFLRRGSWNATRSRRKWESEARRQARSRRANRALVATVSPSNRRDADRNSGTVSASVV
jgi:hypothetical protein